MIANLVSLEGLWGTVFMTALVFGFMPGAVLRIVVLLLPTNDLRRREIVSELYAFPRWRRPTWVAEQLEICLFEGIAARRRERRACVARMHWSTRNMLYISEFMRVFIIANFSLYATVALGVSGTPDRFLNATIAFGLLTLTAFLGFTKGVRGIRRAFESDDPAGPAQICNGSDHESHTSPGHIAGR